MKILNHLNNFPINSLVRDVQAHCTMLLSAPEQYNILDLDDLKMQLQDHIHNVASRFLLCNPNNLSGELHSYRTFEVYNLMYKDSSILISVLARRTEYEAAFQKEDIEVFNRQSDRSLH